MTKKAASSLDSNLHDRQLSLLVSGIRDFAIYLISPEGLVSSWNAGAERFKGYSADEIIGQHFGRFYTPEDQAAGIPLQALERARKEGKFEAEGWRMRKDGSRFWAHVVITPIHDDDGRFVGFAKVTRDITERRNAARALEEAHERLLRQQAGQYRDLLRLFEQAPGFVCFFRGPLHVYELQNKAHHRLAEYKDIIGKPVREALPELEGQGFFELLDQVFTTGKPYVGRALPLAVKPADGKAAEQRYIDFVYQPIFGDEGEIVGVFSQGSDVTEQVRAQVEVQRKQTELEALLAERTKTLEETRKALILVRELQGDKRHLLQLFDQAPGFICVLNGPNHVFEIANKAYLALVGTRDLLGRPVHEALPEVKSQGFVELLHKVYATAEPFIGRGLPLTVQPDPKEPAIVRYVDFVYQPVIGPDGSVIGIFVQGNDVTEYKAAQDEVRRYQADLERLVVERTRKLEEMQLALQRSQKLEAVGKLTGGVAHDFNNILQVIAGNLQLLQIGASAMRSDTAMQTRLQSALDAVERGAKLSSQLLAFARRQPLQPTVLNPTRLIRAMDDLIRRAIGEMIHVETIAAGGLWNTLVDPHQLENVILNLVINARDAMPQGGKLTIEVGNTMLDDEYVSGEGDLRPGQYVVFAISDTGTGMTREVLERACDPFFTTKPEGVGTGLGLSMAYGFVKQSGGHLKIYSEVGHGTTIRMYFPRAYDAELDVTPSSTPAAAASGTETILVVEDDLAVQRTVVEILSSLGYRVLKADNAESALVVLKSGLPIDLLFTDVVMPGELRSPELARQAKLLHPNIEVLFTSGYTQNAIVHGGRLDPGLQLLTKPYRREQLAAKIRQLLNKGE
jgi:PAS domain S-box-containing protein